MPSGRAATPPISTSCRRCSGDRLRVHAGAENQRLDLGATFKTLPRGAMAFVCGPMRLLDDARRQWAVDGRAPTDLRYETFGSSGLLPTEAFTVRIRETGAEIVVPQGRSMLDALNEAGYEVMSDCRRGECGVCCIDVADIQGEVDHRDVFLSEHQKREGRKICPCVSRASRNGDRGHALSAGCDRAGRADRPRLLPASSADRSGAPSPSAIPRR